MALAFLVPAAPAVAHAGSPGPDQACQTVERKVYHDVREIVRIDLDTATNTEVRLLANQIAAAAKADSLTTLPGRLQERLDGTADDLRAFLKTNLLVVWTTDLRVAVNQSMTGAGANVKAAAQKVLDDGTADALLGYLNDGLYVARALDCATRPTSAAPTSTPASPSGSTRPTGTVTSAPTTAATSAGTTPTSAPASASAAATTAAASTPAGGSMPVTGANTGTIVAIGGTLLVLGGASILLTRRRRTVAGE